MVQIASTSANSIAANTKSSDYVTGTYQFAPFDGDLTVYAKASATGLNITVVVNGTAVINDQAIVGTGTAGTLDKSANEVATIEVPQGARVEIYGRNTTGGAITLDMIAELE